MKLSFPRARLLPALLLAALAVGGPVPARAQIPTPVYAGSYTEPYRPQFHFSPPVFFMNDPNGLVYFQGEYHLYYQYNPLTNVAGNQCWGHAVSKDLVRWQNLPIAISEVPGVEQIFSGSAVVDRKNTSGFFNGITGGGLVAVYAGNDVGKQTQNLAFSTDLGRTFTKYAGNPVLDLNNPQFRDPFVFWHPPTHRWVMVVSLAEERTIQFYSSADLKTWQRQGSFGSAGAVGGQYECPALVQVPVEGSTTKKWVLLVSDNPGGYYGGSSTQYFVGKFDGKTFTNDNSPEQIRWLDYGKDLYATSAYNDLPAGSAPTVIGWMSNWGYSQVVPTSPWRSAQSVPRTLSLRNTSDGLIVAQRPVHQLTSLRGAVLSTAANVTLDGTNPATSFALPAGNAGVDLTASVRAPQGGRFEVALQNSQGEEVVVGYDFDQQELFADRGKALGYTLADNQNFTARVPAYLPNHHGQLTLRVLFDTSSVEVFANDGERVQTTIFFLRNPAQSVALRAVGGSAVTIRRAKAYSVNSIWR